MKKLLLILLCLPMIGFGQENNTITESSTQIISTYDKYKETTLYHSPFFHEYKGIIGMKYPVVFLKGSDSPSKVKGEGVILNLHTTSSQLTAKPKGVWILFVDGDIMKFTSQKIEYESNDKGSWDYDAYIELSPEQLEKFLTTQMDGFKLHLHENNFGAGTLRDMIMGWAIGIKEIE